MIFIISAVCLGGSRLIYSYIDEVDSEECVSMPRAHNSYINSVVYLPPTLIATCCNDGDIVIRSIQDGMVY